MVDGSRSFISSSVPTFQCRTTIVAVLYNRILSLLLYNYYSTVLV